MSPGGHVIEAEVERQRDDRAVELRVAPRLENVAVVRTLVGAVGTFEDLDVDTVADLRLAVDEACTLLVGSATPDATLVVVVAPCDTDVVVQVSAVCEPGDVMAPDSFSWHVLTSLADDVNTYRGDPETEDGSGVFGVILTTRRVDVAK
jgi:anti-sigma regulatory factor (Ser/Thr protein kinase)